MSERDGKAYVFAWDSNTRDHCGARIVKFRVCYALRQSNRWSKPFPSEQAALDHAGQVDGFGNLISRELFTGTDRDREESRQLAEAAELTARLRSPGRDITHLAGVLERESPLFFGTGDNPILF